MDHGGAQHTAYNGYPHCGLHSRRYGGPAQVSYCLTSFRDPYNAQRPHTMPLACALELCAVWWRVLQTTSSAHLQRPRHTRHLQMPFSELGLPKADRHTTKSGGILIDPSGIVKG